MKRLTLIISSILIAFVLLYPGTKLSASSPRTVLLEEATQWNCGPCAQQNPVYEAYLKTQDLKKVIPMAYHGWWPQPDNDAMYLDDQVMHKARIDYYAINGVPSERVNGSYTTSPGSTSAIDAQIKAVIDQDCPYTITIKETRTGTTQITVNLEVIVATDVALSGVKLRVAGVERHHNYTPAGGNGENDFYYVTRVMKPNASGADVNIAAGKSQTWTFSYVTKSAWTAKEMYSVAFLQNDGTKEVLQAASSIDIASALVLNVPNKWDRIDRSASLPKIVTIQNPNSFTANFDVAVDLTNSTIPAGWTYTVSPAKITNLAAGATADVTVTLKSNANAGCAIVTVSATPNTNHLMNEAASNQFIALTTDTKIAYYAGTSRGDGSNIVRSFNTLTQYTKDAAIIPVAIEAFDAYNASDFDLMILNFDFTNRGIFAADPTYYSTIGQKLHQAVNSMLANGKRVLITSEVDLAYANGTNGGAIAKYFYSSVLQVTLGSTLPRFTDNGNGTITPNQFSAQGVANDPITAGISLTMNQYNSQTYPYFNYYSDVIKINSGSPCVPIINFSSPAGIGGVRMQQDNGKLVYYTFGLEAIPNDASRTDLMRKTIAWLLSGANKKGPEIEVSSSDMIFDKVDVKVKKTMTITIKNTGDEPLIVNDMTMDASFDPDGVFILDNPPSTPFTLDTGKSKDISVAFTPIDAKTYQGNLTFYTNAKTTPDRLISLSGEGQPSGNVSETTTEDGTFAFSATPNPTNISANISYRINGNIAKNIEMSLIDMSGRKISEVLNRSVAPGTYNQELNTNNLASGTYYLVANIEGSMVQIPVIVMH